MYQKLIFPCNVSQRRTPTPAISLAVARRPGRRLVIDRNFRQAIFGQAADRRLVRDRKAGKAGPQHQRHLVDQNIANRPHLAGKIKTAAQQRGMAETTPVIEGREADGDKVDTVEIGLEPG